MGSSHSSHAGQAAASSISTVVETTLTTVLSAPATSNAPFSAAASPAASFSQSVITISAALASSTASLSQSVVTSSGTLASPAAASSLTESVVTSSTALANPTALLSSSLPAMITLSISSTLATMTTAPLAELSTSTSLAAAAVTGLQEAANAPPPVISQPAKGPFSPETAILGGVPNKSLDVPLTAFFMVLFVAGAATHFIRHELNSKRGHKFHLSDLVFDFCMVRNITCIMRIVWATKPTNNSIILAALIFENAGVVVLFAINVVLTQRIIRAIHPNFGWNPIVSKFFVAMLASVPMIIIWNIVNLVVSFFTLNPKVLEKVHDLLLFGSSWTTYLSFFPIIFLIPATIIPCKGEVEKFGMGHFRTKIIFLVLISAALGVGTITRLIGAVVVFPFDKPGRIDSKVVFYTTGFMLEILVVASYHLVRFDLIFHIPDGSSGPGDYSGKNKLLDDAAKMGEDDLTDFQNVDVKMRMSIQNFAVASGDKLPESIRSTRDEVRQAMSELQLRRNIVGQPVDSGDSELLIYAFRVKKGDASRNPPSLPSEYTRNSMEQYGYPEEKGYMEESVGRNPPSYYKTKIPLVPNGLPSNPRPPPRNSAWKRASRGYWNMRQSLV